MDQQRGHRRGGHPLDRAVPDGVIVPQEEKDAYDNASPAERKDILQGFVGAYSHVGHRVSGYTNLFTGRPG